MKPIPNTEFKILCLIRENAGGVTALECVTAFYKTSKQPLKKAKTFYGYLSRMRRRGWLAGIALRGAAQFTEVRFRLTSLGRRVGNSEVLRQEPSQQPFMRMVSE